MSKKKLKLPVIKGKKKKKKQKKQKKKKQITQVTISQIWPTNIQAINIEMLQLHFFFWTDIHNMAILASILNTPRGVRDSDPSEILHPEYNEIKFLRLFWKV